MLLSTTHKRLSIKFSNHKMFLSIEYDCTSLVKISGPKASNFSIIKAITTNASVFALIQSLLFLYLLARFLQTHLFNSHFLFTQLDESDDTDDEDKQESLLFVEQDKDFTDDFEIKVLELDDNGLEDDDNDLEGTTLDDGDEELDNLEEDKQEPDDVLYDEQDPDDVLYDEQDPDDALDDEQEPDDALDDGKEPDDALDDGQEPDDALDDWQDDE